MDYYEEISISKTEKLSGLDRMEGCYSTGLFSGNRVASDCGACRSWHLLPIVSSLVFALVVVAAAAVIVGCIEDMIRPQRRACKLYA